MGFVGDLSNAIEACVQKRCSLVTGHGTVATEGAVGIAGDAAVLLNQVAQSLVSPVGRIDVRELGDAGDLLLSGVIRDAGDVQVGSLCHRSQKAQSSRSHQQLLEKLHGVPHTKKGQCPDQIVTFSQTSPSNGVPVFTPTCVIRYQNRAYLLTRSPLSPQFTNWGT